MCMGWAGAALALSRRVGALRLYIASSIDRVHESAHALLFDRRHSPQQARMARHRARARPHSSTCSAPSLGAHSRPRAMQPRARPSCCSCWRRSRTDAAVTPSKASNWSMTALQRSIHPWSVTGAAKVGGVLLLPSQSTPAPAARRPRPPPGTCNRSLMSHCPSNKPPPARATDRTRPGCCPIS